MSLIVRTIIAVAATSFAATTALAGAGGFPTGGNGPAQVKQVKLSLNGFTGGCPSNGALITRVETTGLGNFQIRYRKAGGGKSDLITVAAVKTQNGKYVAKHVQPMTLATTTNTKYMVESGAKISPWVDVKTPCAGASAVTPGLPLGG
jgi:hypothetical protein